MKKYDVFVFGTGIAGKVVATNCAQAGLAVAIIDTREYGGTCSQRGCDPKKIMLAPIEAYEHASKLYGYGIAAMPVLDFGQIHQYAKKYTQGIPAKTAEQLQHEGIACYRGEATFKNPNVITLNKTDIYAKTFIIATGLITRPLTIPGSEFLKEYDDFFKLQKAPQKVVFIGGGYIALEFGHMLARAGSKVTIIETGNRILKNFEESVTLKLQKITEDLGVKIILNARASSVEATDGRYVVNYGKEDGIHQVTASAVFNTAGRIPAVKSLKLERAGVVTSKTGVVVNEFMQSISQPHIYACGDVSSMGLPLTPLSSLQGTIVANNILGKKEELHLPAIPSAVFTIPQLAAIGLTEKQALQQGREITILENDASNWFNARRIKSDGYQYKIILEKETGAILGAHIMGAAASDQINMFAIAIKAGMSMEDLKSTIFTYPSWGNDILSYK
jgi:glutathione reductase (NADPH)